MLSFGLNCGSPWRGETWVKRYSFQKAGEKTIPCRGGRHPPPKKEGSVLSEARTAESRRQR